MQRARQVLRLPREEEVEAPLHGAGDADEAAENELVDGNNSSDIGCAKANNLGSLFCESFWGDS